jgi:hypothetical protein
MASDKLNEAAWGFLGGYVINPTARNVTTPTLVLTLSAMPFLLIAQPCPVYP